MCAGSTDRSVDSSGLTVPTPAISVPSILLPRTLQAPEEPKPELTWEMAPRDEVDVWGSQRLLLAGLFTFVVVVMVFFAFLKIARP